MAEAHARAIPSVVAIPSNRTGVIDEIASSHPHLALLSPQNALPSQDSVTTPFHTSHFCTTSSQSLPLPYT